MKSTEITNIIESILTEEVKNAITTEAGTTKRVKYHVTCEGEPLASFDSIDEAKDYVEKNKDGELKGKKKLLIDKKTYGSYQEMIDHLDEIAQSLEEKQTENMENQQPMEGNAYIKAMLDAKEKGEESFEVDGETHNVKESWKQLEEEEGMCEGAGCSGEMMEGEICETCGCKECECGKKETNEGGKGTCSECGTMLQEDGSCNECAGKMNESKKVKIRLSESELTKLISKLVMEAIPGLEAVKKSHSQSSGQDLKDSNKKIDDYLKGVSGSTKPEFPNQEGTEKEKEAYRNTSDEEEFIDTYRGKGLQDLDYDNKPSKEFIERLRMALEGDPKMGNGQKDTANTIPSNVGKDFYNSIEKEKEKRHAEPAYKKDPAPTKEVNESVKEKSVVMEEIDRIKNMANYNKKTQ